MIHNIIHKKDPIPTSHLDAKNTFGLVFVEDGTNLKNNSYDHLNCYLIPTV